MGIQLPDDIGSHWDLPVDRPIKRPLVVISLPNSWPITIAKLSPWIVGICWTHSSRQHQAISLENNVSFAVGVIMELLPIMWNILFLSWIHSF